MADLKDIETRLSAALALVDSIQNERSLWFGAAENNVFASIEDAEASLYKRLLGEACQDCEGSYNCGADEYTQEFIVNGVHYIGTLSVEYSRYDKRYYYVDGTEWKVEEKVQR